MARTKGESAQAEACARPRPGSKLTSFHGPAGVRRRTCTSAPSWRAGVSHSRRSCPAERDTLRSSGGGSYFTGGRGGGGEGKQHWCELLVPDIPENLPAPPQPRVANRAPQTQTGDTPCRLSLEFKMYTQHPGSEETFKILTPLADKRVINSVFWREILLTFLGSLRGAWPEERHPALCCTQFYPRTFARAVAHVSALLTFLPAGFLYPSGLSLCWRQHLDLPAVPHPVC